MKKLSTERGSFILLYVPPHVYFGYFEDGKLWPLETLTFV